MAIDYDKGMRPNLYELMQGGGGGGGYVLPPATEDTLGGVKIGEGVNVESDGTISVDTGAPVDAYTKQETDELIEAERNGREAEDLPLSEALKDETQARAEKDQHLTDATIFNQERIQNLYDTTYSEHEVDNLLDGKLNRSGFNEISDSVAIGYEGNAFLELFDYNGQKFVRIMSKDDTGDGSFFEATKDEFRIYNEDGWQRIKVSDLKDPIAAHDAAHKQYVDTQVATKQDALVSGTNIKTLNSQSLLGSGNIEIEAPENAVVNDGENTVTNDFWLRSSDGASELSINDYGLMLRRQNGLKSVEFNLDDSGLEVFSYDEDENPNPLPVTFNLQGAFSLSSDDGVAIKGVVTPTQNTDAANKKYVDDSIAGIQPQFMRLDFNQALTDMQLLPVTDDSAPTQTRGRVDVVLPEQYQADWAIVGLVKYECKYQGARVDAIRVYEFTMTNQTVLRLGLKTSGSVANKPIDTIAGALLLIRRS